MPTRSCTTLATSASRRQCPTPRSSWSSTMRRAHSWSAICWEPRLPRQRWAGAWKSCSSSSTMTSRCRSSSWQLRPNQRVVEDRPMPKWENRCKIALSGVGYSKVTRSADLPLAAHALEAVKGAIADCGLKTEDVDGLSTYPELPATGHAEVDGISVVSVNCMMAMLKLPNLTWHMQVGSNNIGGAVQQAANALLAGVCQYAVVWRAMHNPKGTYQNLPGAQAVGATQFTGPFGFGGPGQHMAVAYTRYLERHHQSRDKMVTLALVQREHAQHNPHAFFYGTPLTREDYFNSRMVAYPFCLYDCDIPVQGAVAVVLTTAERARDLKPKPAYLASYGQRLYFEVAGRIGSLADYMEGGASSAKLTWERSGFSPKDVDVAQ